jgi:hypothetical protein
VREIAPFSPRGPRARARIAASIRRALVAGTGRQDEGCKTRSQTGNAPSRSSINHDLDSCELRCLRSQPPTGARGSTATQPESRSRSTSAEKKRKKKQRAHSYCMPELRAVGFHVRLPCLPCLPTHTHHDNTMRQAFPLLLPPITALGAPMRRAQVGSYTRGARCWLLAETHGLPPRGAGSPIERRPRAPALLTRDLRSKCRGAVVPWCRGATAGG